MRNLYLSIPFIVFFLFHLQIFSQDKFVEIATSKYQMREQLLIVPQPPVLSDITLPATNNPNSIFRKVLPISTKEELNAELDKLREHYSTFMQDLAPAFKQMRTKTPLTEFNWRVKIPSDQLDFVTTLRGGGRVEKSEYTPLWSTIGACRHLLF